MGAFENSGCHAPSRRGLLGETVGWNQSARDDRDPFPWVATLLAGVSEGLLPRQYLHPLETPFRQPD